MKAFTVEGEQEPEACPEGHRADDPEFARILGEAGEEPAASETEAAAEVAR
jgi:hypothetical protein